MKRNQSGFSIVEIILAIVVVGLAGMVGWMYMQNTSKSSETNNSTLIKNSNSQQGRVNPVKATPVTTNTYKSKSLNLAFDYPSTWTIAPNDRENFYDTLYGDRILVKSPEDHALLFNTLSPKDKDKRTGCVTGLKDYKFEGLSRIIGTYILSYSLYDIPSIVLSNNAIAGSIKQDCANKNTQIKIARPSETTPYVVEFGNYVSSEVTTLGDKFEPGSQEYKEAVAILKSLRKI